jgi:transposase
MSSTCNNSEAVKTTQMKNRYLRGAHTSERKFRVVLKLFCEDLTATQIAHISGVSRVTINSYLKLIRVKIAAFCEEKSYYFNDTPAARLMKPAPVAPGADTMLFGIYKSDRGIFTKRLPDADVSGQTLPPKKLNSAIDIYHNSLGRYSGIADFNTHKLIRLRHHPHQPAKAQAQVDEIDFFWGLIKGRLQKFRGINTNTLYLHVKETEFRYNHRNTDIFLLLSNMIQQQPLRCA